MSDFLFENILNKHDASLEAKASASKEFMSTIRPMPESNFKTILIKEFSNKMGIDLNASTPTKKEIKSHTKTKEEEEVELDKVTKSLIKCIIHNPELAKSEYLDFFISNKEFLISPLISFLRGKKNISFSMIIQEFPEQKNILIDLSNDPNLISSDEGLEFVKQAVRYIKKNDKESVLKSLKLKFAENSLDLNEKIELKKILTQKFENLSEDELSLFRKL